MAAKKVNLLYDCIFAIILTSDRLRAGFFYTITLCFKFFETKMDGKNYAPKRINTNIPTEVSM